MKDREILIKLYDTDNKMVGFVECSRFNIEYVDGIPFLYYSVRGVWCYVKLTNWNLSAIKVITYKVVDK